ncbi:DUF6571 family protein [Streptomyces sp. JJ36]|uniref:DUF6571 family protein n=1 Tax=Streptomyces sp. JJ36 TaxID=2736645 RepID=UPI001F42049B|nr:DUF6571 family protein [Streptomyces sp. JJ36]MCF6525101.1 hypothetical protein [Streptomyces sp. JJ36]
MVSYQALLEADLEPLAEAVVKWRNLPGKFRQLGTNFDTDVKRPLTHSDWEGEAADSAHTQFRAVAKQFTEAADEAADVHGVLKTAHDSFKESQDQLKRYKRRIEEDGNLHLDGNGKVTYRAANPDDLSAAEATVQAKNYREVVRSYNSQINEVLTTATEADELLEYALRLDAGGRRDGFSGDGFGSIGEARKGRQQALKDLDALTKLAGGSPEDLTAAELERAGSLLKRHEGDPFFTQSFATRLGPEGTLSFWAQVADQTQYGGERTEALESLQKTLGVALGTASHADSGVPALDREMERWKKDVIRLGPERLTSTDLEAARIDKGPYGFQVMSSLMRYGEYDTGFLTDYGKGFGDGRDHVPGLIEFEKKSAGEGGLEELWKPDGYQPMLNFGKGSDHGMDPMVGYMEALGHNPEAAQKLFHRDGWETGATDKPDPDLQYLLQDREWPDGNVLAEHGRGKGYDELGHALEAAATGRPYDEPELGLHRDRDSANVMSQVVSIVADPDNTGFLDDRPGLENSLAKTGAAYIDDIDHSVAGFGDMEADDARHNEIFRHTGPEGGHILLSEGTTTAFLREVGSSPVGYEILTAAQQRYTANAMLAHPEPNQDLSVIFGTNAEVQGMLNENRASAIQEHLNDLKDEKQKEIEGRAEWTKAAISGGIGIATGIAVAPFAAPTGGAGAVAIPLAVETGALAAETALGSAVDDAVDAEVKEAQDKIDSQGIRDKREFVEFGHRRVAHPLELYANVHPKLEGSDWLGAEAERVERDYYNGVNAANEVDGD